MTTPKQSPKPADDVAAMVERLNQKARGERNSVGDHWGDHICAEAAALLTRLEAYLRDCEARRLVERDRAEAAEKRNAELEARLAESVKVLERVPSALNGMFSAGMEEQRGGSANRQECLAAEGDALRQEIPTLIAKIKEKHDE